ncbi:hypothetical protein CRUP_003080 [Coryphaenoides rupestris]|nr:hypothetical protein CRUP_003080 [Coryphaenoides rupestris]
MPTSRQLPLTVQELQEELRAHREMNSRLQQQQQQQSNSGCYRDFQTEQDHRGASSPGHSPRHSPGPGSVSLLSPVPRHSPRAHSPSNAYSPRTLQQQQQQRHQQQADIIIHSPGYCRADGKGPAQGTPNNNNNSLHPGPCGNSSSHGQHIHHYGGGGGGGCTPTEPPPPPLSPRSPCLVPGCDGFSSPLLPPETTTATSTAAAEQGFQRLQTEHERKAKELALLRRTMEEMELRIEVQKKTLGARDESIQRLLEMLQGQGGHAGPGGSRLAPKPGIITVATHDAEAQLENLHLREHHHDVIKMAVDLHHHDVIKMAVDLELHRRNQADPAKARALQTVIDMKDTKISSLERNIRDLEDEVQMLKTGGVLHSDDRHDDLKQVEVYKSHSKFMKSKELHRRNQADPAKARALQTVIDMKNIRDLEDEVQMLKTGGVLHSDDRHERPKQIDQLKQELNKKEADMQAVRTKLETLTNQNSDSKQHIDLEMYISLRNPDFWNSSPGPHRSPYE